MTVSEYIANWLQGYDGTMQGIETDRLAAVQQAFGLIKSPADSTRTDITGIKTVTSYYQYYARRSSVNEAQRVANQEWLEALQDWADENSLPAAPFPKGTLESIGISNTFSAVSQDTTETVYQITIRIIYRKE